VFEVTNLIGLKRGSLLSFDSNIHRGYKFFHVCGDCSLAIHNILERVKLG
jgi:hypothetical protein